MAETPETPTPSLAERLDRFRIVIAGDGQRSIVMNPQVSDEDRTAAVAQLRQLDRIKAALGPVSNIRRVGAQLPDCTSYSLASLGQWLTGVADALEADDGA